MTDQKGAEQAASSLAEQVLNQARARYAPSESADNGGLEPLKKKSWRKAVANPASSTLQDLQKTLWATTDKVRANMDAAEYTQLRDTLLPRLISGQLRLREAEEMVEEVCA